MIWNGHTYPQWLEKGSQSGHVVKAQTTFFQKTEVRQGISQGFVFRLIVRGGFHGVTPKEDRRFRNLDAFE